jgi:Kef-type K+ transport system membrane component KefB
MSEQTSATLAAPAAAAEAAGHAPRRPRSLLRLLPSSLRPLPLLLLAAVVSLALAGAARNSHTRVDGTVSPRDRALVAPPPQAPVDSGHALLLPDGSAGAAFADARNDTPGQMHEQQQHPHQLPPEHIPLAAREIVDARGHQPSPILQQPQEDPLAQQEQNAQESQNQNHPRPLAPPAAIPPHPHEPSRLFRHFDADADGLLSEKEVAALLKQLTRKRREEAGSRLANTGGGGSGGGGSGSAGLPSGGSGGAAAPVPGAPGAGLLPGADSRDPRVPGRHDIVIDGEPLSVGDGDFDLLFKQLSNLKHTKDPSKDPRMTLQEDIVFVKDLVIVFFAATLGGVIATHFRQPPLIGFLLGGMTVGPGGFGVVTELVEVETLASLGIAFLLFSLGIEFSINDFHGVRRVVTVGGLLSLAAIVVFSSVLSLALGLVKTIPEGTALGLAVSLSSTAVVLQCLNPDDDQASSNTQPGNSIAVEGSVTSPSPRGPSPHGSAGISSSSASTAMKTTHNATQCATPGFSASSVLESSLLAHAISFVRPSSPIARVDATTSSPRKAPGQTLSYHRDAGGFDSVHSRKVMLGLLVFQDVTIGLILALLPTLQGTLLQFVEELLRAVLRLGCFVMLSLILAEFLLPTLSDGLDRARSQEVFTVGVVVFCLAMSYLSERMGLAIELGAFAAGIMLSESRLKHRVETSIDGIRNMFSAVFFVSVGMMIHWRYFYQNFLKMLMLLSVIVVTKAVVFTVIIYTLGKLSMRTAIACGAAISQAGEFTFVVASKGQALLLFSASEARMINGATALSMLASPYIIRYARSFAMRSTVRGTAASMRVASGDVAEP